MSHRSHNKDGNTLTLSASRYTLVPDLESDGEDNEEEEKDPLKTLSKQQKKEELERKNRWIDRFEKESRAVDAKSVGAISRADQCIDDLDREINEKESGYSRYKTAV